MHRDLPRLPVQSQIPSKRPPSLADRLCGYGFEHNLLMTDAQALRGSGAAAVYIASKQLAAIGTAPGAIFRYSYQTLRWANFLDGVVVFQMEQPPTSTKGN